jgi:hypothetical protein
LQREVDSFTVVYVSRTVLFGFGYAKTSYTKDRNRLNLEPALILALTKICFAKVPLLLY